jgi:UDP-glucuronate 4-epimerase
MALFKFTKAILNNEPIDLYNNGDMKRDFTYIDDIVEGIVRTLANPPEIDIDWNSNQPDPATSGLAPYQVFNIGNNQPVHLIKLVEILEKILGRTALKNYMPMQAGDVEISWASSDELIKKIGYSPATSIEEGLQNFVGWYLDYFKIKI